MERLNSNQLDDLFEKIKSNISCYKKKQPKENYKKKKKLGIIGVTQRNSSFTTYYYKDGKNTVIGTFPLLHDAAKARFVSELRWGVKKRGSNSEQWLIKNGFEKWVKKMKKTIKREVKK